MAPAGVHMNGRCGCIMMSQGGCIMMSQGWDIRRRGLWETLDDQFHRPKSVYVIEVYNFLI